MCRGGVRFADFISIFLNFYLIRRLGPSIFRSLPKNIRNIKYPQKIFEILATPKNIPILYLKKDPKMHRNDPKTSPIFCDDPKKYPQNLHTPKIFIFLKPPKNIENQNFEPPKNSPSLRMCEIIRVPPWGGDPPLFSP